MQQLENSLPSIGSLKTSGADSSTTPMDSSTAKPSGSLADYLWLHMSATYPHKWTSALGDDPRGVAGRVWASELSGMSREQIDTGLDACRNSSDPWPPALAEFKARCLGIPSLSAVSLELKSAKCSPFARLVWSYVDAYRIKLVSADQSDRQVRDAYELAREHVMRGGALPVIAGKIEQEKPKPPVELSPEEKAGRLARVRAELDDVPPPAPAEPEAPKADLAAVEAELQQHDDRKTAAAGGDA